MRQFRIIAFAALVLVQVIVVGTMAATREIVIQSGDEVVLETRPIDPRDLFRGDYVILRYWIGEIDRDEVDWDAGSPRIGQTVQVVLEEEDGLAQAVRVVRRRAQVAGLIIRGRVESVSGTTVHLSYGIEEFFVPEGTGREIQWADRVDVAVSLSARGDAVIRYLLVDGERWGG